MTDPQPGKGRPLAGWQRLVELYDDELWRRGFVDGARHDLMSIALIGRDEQRHSRVLEWLLDPRGSHGLGSTVLRRVLEAGWGSGAAQGCERARVRREQEKGMTRADVVVDIGRGTLVVENKVDAPEQVTQCDDFVNRWGTETKYLFLSPSGRRPTSATTPAAQMAFRWTSYGALGRLLRELLPQAQGPGRPALEDYVTTIDRQFQLRPAFIIDKEEDVSPSADLRAPDPLGSLPDRFDVPDLRFYIEHRPEILSVAMLDKKFEATLGVEVRGLLPVVKASLEESYGPVEADNLHWARGADHPLFWAPRWASGAGLPLAAIGLKWDGTDVEGKSLYSGVFVPSTAEAAPLREWLDHDLPEPPRDAWERGLYPVAYRYVEPIGGWWARLPEWRASLVMAVHAAWERFAPRIDEAIEEIAHRGP